MTEAEKTPMKMGQRGVQLGDYDQLWRFAAMVYGSGMCPKSFRSAEQVAVAVQYGMELGLGPMTSLQAIAVINGTPALYGDGLLAVCQRHPEWGGIAETMDAKAEEAVCVVRREGSPDVEARFSMADAKRAGLLGKRGPWETHPGRMLQMRARSRAVRAQFADATLGLVTAEEAAELPPRDVDYEVAAKAPQTIEDLVDQGGVPKQLPEPEPETIEAELF